MSGNWKAINFELTNRIKIAFCGHNSTRTERIRITEVNIIVRLFTLMGIIQTYSVNILVIFSIFVRAK